MYWSRSFLLRCKRFTNRSITTSVLQDTFNRHHNYLRISITERCNLRCKYCMPAEGVQLSPVSSTLTTPEIIRLVSLFVSQGVDKVRLTGGEPTVRSDLIPLMKELNMMKPRLKTICMTSNGIALSRKLPELVSNGLTNLNLSLDTLIDGKFILITRRNGLKAVLKSLYAAIELGLENIKINVVIMKGINEDELIPFTEMTRELPIDVRFIEYMPFEGNKWSKKKMVSYQNMYDTICQRYNLKRKNMKFGDTSKNFGIAGHKGSIGFITSMTENFCSGCNRLRITNDGNLKVCLFGNNEVSLRDLMRKGCSDQEILGVISQAVNNKKKEHAGLGTLENLPNRPMILIAEYLRSRKPRQLNITSNNYSYSKKIIHQERIQFECISKRFKSTFTHVNKKGEANMVDIYDKPVTHRTATARGIIKFSNTNVIAQTELDNNKKGDVLSVARISAIMGVKRTSELIPLCHNIPITKIKVNIEILKEINGIEVECTVQCSGKTGVEMEALTGVNVGLLTVYDMCKALDKSMVIEGVRVVQKIGGKSDFKES